MSSQRSILRYDRLLVRAGAIPDIVTPTGSWQIIGSGPVEATVTHGRFYIEPSDEQKSLKEINRRLHSINPPLEGGETDDAEVSVTASS